MAADVWVYWADTQWRKADVRVYWVVQIGIRHLHMWAPSTPIASVTETQPREPQGAQDLFFSSEHVPTFDMGVLTISFKDSSSKNPRSHIQGSLSQIDSRADC